MNHIKVSQPLLLDGAKNVRDLGGYPARSGLVTASRVFLRADGLQNLTDNDIQKLTDYYMLQSKPESMEQTIRYFRQKYTDAENYLIHFCRCSREDVEFIRNRLLGGLFGSQ
ncbi:MAG: tyrosine-protein phosphatase [Clostridiales bacterium]|nr:tyrosine-protein phosphatase [Clostridiales bacterium]